MAASTPNKILLRSGNIPFVKYSLANGASTPGDILERATDGDFQRNSTAGGSGPLLVCDTNDIGGEITESYATADNVRAFYAQPGDEIYAFVPANAAAIVIGDELILDGTGCFIKATAIALGASGLTGTVTGTMADVANIALSTSNTYTDSAVNTAVNAAILGANLQLKELATKLEGTAGFNGVIRATALEAVNNSAGGSKARIRVEVIR
jgi:hypothetical protein